MHWTPGCFEHVDRLLMTWHAWCLCHPLCRFLLDFCCFCYTLCFAKPCATFAQVTLLLQYWLGSWT
jgi:hypothetical protein